MSTQMTTAYRLWDEILKAIVYVMPNQLFPLIRDVYGKEYPPGTSIMLLNSEHSNYLDTHGAPLSSNLMDISLLVADTDYYHIECQMHNDKTMGIRMILYDLHYAIEHCVSKDHMTDELIIRFPHSFVLYPNQNEHIPNSLTCRIIFQDGSEHIYRIPTVKVQSYSLEEIHEKHLNLFIPYLLLRLKPRFNSKNHPLSKKELTDFLNEIIFILQDDLTNGYLTRMEYDDYINLLVRASEHIFNRHPKYHTEVQRMTKPLIYLPSMQFKDMEARLEEQKSVLAKQASVIAERELSIAEKDSALAEKDSALAEKDSEIAILRAKLAALTRQ